MIPEHYTAQRQCLCGKTLLVTGASDGIGRAAALAYAAHGASVVLLARKVDKLAAVYDAIEAAGGRRPTAIPFDLSHDSEAPYLELARVLEDQCGHLDGLLLNAGVLGERRPLEQTPWSRWREVMQINIDSAFLTLKALMPLLRAAPRASVVLTSSGVGRRGRAYWGAYAVSKFATEGLVQVLADEMENTARVRVNAINPGATNTAMRRAAYPGEQPTDNPAPEEIMRPYLFLMDDVSASVNGQSLDAQGLNTRGLDTRGLNTRG